jgi:hypothetical protein
MRIRRRLACGTVGLLLTAACAFAGVSIKLTGGLGYVVQGDYGRALRGAYTALKASYPALEGDFRPFRFDLRGGLEVLVPFGEGFEIGLGAGYERLSVDNRFSYFWLFVTLEDVFQSRATVIPLTLNLHKTQALGPRLGLDLFGGAGYYSIHFRHIQSTDTDFFAFNDVREFEARTGAFGFQGGLALDYSLGPGIDLVLQADGRLVRLSEIKGDLKDTASWFLGQSTAQTAAATFWAYDATIGTSAYTLGTFAAGEPADASLSNVRPAGLDLSGFGISAGLRLRF